MLPFIFPNRAECFCLFLFFIYVYTYVFIFVRLRGGRVTVNDTVVGSISERENPHNLALVARQNTAMMMSRKLNLKWKTKCLSRSFSPPFCYMRYKVWVCLLIDGIFEIIINTFMQRWFISLCFIYVSTHIDKKCKKRSKHIDNTLSMMLEEGPVKHEDPRLQPPLRHEEWTRWERYDETVASHLTIPLGIKREKNKIPSSKSNPQPS